MRTLKVQGSCTIKELSAATKVSPVSVRHHLVNLQAANFVQSEEVRQGVGRPHHEFSLTETGLERFPGRYFRLTNRLLTRMKDSLPRGMVVELFISIGHQLAEEYSLELKSLPLKDRVNRLVELLSDEGFAAEVDTSDDQVLIRELSCPYLKIGRAHPEVCMVDQEFIATALDLPIQRVSWLLEGDSHCSFALAEVESYE
jgi:predicted ArsR family transcriptional regulator